MIIVLALGDSLTAGYGLAPEHSFAFRLEQALGDEGNDVQVINGGVSGDTAHDGLLRLDGLLKHHPDLVIVEFGANDVYMGLPVDDVRSSLERIIDRCRETGAFVFLAGVASLQDPDEDYSMRFHKAFDELAKSKGISFLPDFLPGIPGNPELTLPDGIHPNESGVDRMVENILPGLRPLMAQISSQEIRKKN